MKREKERETANKVRSEAQKGKPRPKGGERVPPREGARSKGKGRKHKGHAAALAFALPAQATRGPDGCLRARLLRTNSPGTG